MKQENQISGLYARVVQKTTTTIASIFYLLPLNQECVLDSRWRSTFQKFHFYTWSANEARMLLCSHLWEGDQELGRGLLPPSLPLLPPLFPSSPQSSVSGGTRIRHSPDDRNGHAEIWGEREDPLTLLVLPLMWCLVCSPPYRQFGYSVRWIFVEYMSICRKGSIYNWLLNLHY